MSEHIKGRYSIIVAIIAALATIIAAFIGLNGEQDSTGTNSRIDALEQQLANLQEEVSVLERDKAELQSENENLRNQLSKQTLEIQDAVFFKGHKYQAFSDSMTWMDAKSKCESLGGHLATVTDAEESIFITTYISHLESPKNCYWIGLYYDDSKQTWAWITDEPFNFENWAADEPNGDEENYVHIYGNKYGTTDIGEWNDNEEWGSTKPSKFFYFDNFGFICEWDVS